MARKTRVLFVIPTLDSGGAEMDLVHNAPRLDPERFEVIVCAMLRRGPLEPLLQAAGVPVVGPYRDPERSARKPKERPRTRGWLTRLAAQFRSVVRRTGAAGRAWRATTPLPPWVRVLGRVGRRVRFRPWPLIGGVRLILWLIAGVRAILGGMPSSDPKSALHRIRRRVLGLLPVHWIIFLRMANWLVDIIRANRIDIVHAILPNAYVVGGIACAMTRRRLVMSRVSLNWYQREQPVYLVLERRLVHRLVARAIGNSGQIIEELKQEGIPARRLRLVHNGIPLREFDARTGDRAATRLALGLPADGLVMTAVGNLWIYKGYADLLEALYRVVLPEPWTLLIAGRDIDGQAEALATLSSQLGLTGRVRFLGERRDIPALLKAADLHLTASHTEGLPNNVLEAMCAGLPVIATRVGGIPELVVDGETGLLVPVRSPSAMAAAITRLASDAGLRSRMGLAARRRVEDQFSIERSVASLERIYTELAR